MTYLIVPITAGTSAQAKADLLRARELGADMVELRLDHMSGAAADIAALREAVGRNYPFLLTPRSPDEGGAWNASDATRAVQLASVSPYGNMCDIELATFDRNPPSWTKLLRDMAREWQASGPARILSAHDFKQRPANLCRIVERMNEIDECDVAKVVFQAKHISECFELLDLMHGNPKPVIAIAMGEAGLITRILAKKFGAFGTFASLEAGKESAPGQITINEMKNLYRWDAIHKDTAVYGVIGNPVGHSMSPAIHNAAFERCGINAVYVPLLIEPTYEHFEDFLREALARPWFNLGGVSVTIPHKANALRYAMRREARRIEPLAVRIGAVNTLTFERGEVYAENTDYAGALDALTGAMGCSRADLRDVEVGVLGAGGVSRAIVAGLCDCGCRVTIYNRTAERAKQLADEFGCTAAPNDERVRPGTKIVVNATSIGMHPNVGETPLPADRLRPDMTIFDTVYNPIETRLLREARQVGCRTVDGVTMFVNQAAAQFERWTGQPAARDLMREVVVRRLSGR
jgi:3-dehydroquinate dehydratase/shikimate dehydrogenase